MFILCFVEKISIFAEVKTGDEELAGCVGLHYKFPISIHNHLGKEYWTRYRNGMVI